MTRCANTASGSALPYANDGVFGEFSRHRRFNNPIARDLMRDTDTRDIGQKIANCALTIKARVVLQEGPFGSTWMRAGCIRRVPWHQLNLDGLHGILPCTSPFAFLHNSVSAKMRRCTSSGGGLLP